MSKNKYFSVVVIINEDVAAASLIYLHEKKTKNDKNRS